MRKNISSVIFIGAAWGMVEATVGHVIHILSLGIGWMVWFPLAFFFLNSIYGLTKRTSCMLYSAIIAAGIKLIDLFYTPRLDYVINPAVSIILEALTVFAVYQYMLRKDENVKLNYIHVMVAAFGWKVLYISYLFFLPESWIEISSLRGMIPFAKFFFLESVLNTIMLSLCMVAYRKLISLRLKIFQPFQKLYNNRIFLPVFSCLILILAVIIQINL